MSRRDHQTGQVGNYTKWWNVYGCWSVPDDLVFEFLRHDGGSDRFSGGELRSATWWQAMSPTTVDAIEAHLHPLPHDDLTISYVARADMKKGGVLIRGSLLSEFFEGDGRGDEARKAWECLRLQWPDAAVFETCSITDAQRCLAAEDPNAEGLRIMEERLALARACRAERALTGTGQKQSGAAS